MTISKEATAQIAAIARESLDIFSDLAESAKSHISRLHTSGSTPWSNRQELLKGYYDLEREPAIARVVVIDSEQKEITYFICRAAPDPSAGRDVQLASYRSPAGRMAALPVGAEYTLPRGSVRILQSAVLHPLEVGGEWDSENSVLNSNVFGPITVESFRKLLAQTTAEIDKTLLDRLLSQESADDNVREGIRRSVIKKMELRDQPILDQYQDSIFRMPLNSRLLILGAPGTGKTTTLIRRLGQKLDTEFLSDDEKRVIAAEAQENGIAHANNWIMFTPTELLKLYVKEAFSREGIPAPDDRILTWADYREDLSRNEFRILRSGSNRGSYVVRRAASHLKDECVSESVVWFTDFDRWQKLEFWDEMRVSAERLSKSTADETAGVGARLLSIVGGGGDVTRPRTFVALMAMRDSLQRLVRALREWCDSRIHAELNDLVNYDQRVLDEIANLNARITAVESDQEDREDDTEDEEESQEYRDGRRGAFAYYTQAIQAHARARVRGRSVAKSSRAGRLIELLGDRIPSNEDLREIGNNLLLQSALRQFVNPVRRYVDGITTRYRRFRRTRQREGRWYAAESIKAADVHPLEVDVILLAMMRSTDDLIKGPRILADDDSPSRTTLQRLQRLRRTQVLVDEATDFSPIQLACMMMIASPASRSFFACGDFNQRVTEWGARSVEEIGWAVPHVDTQRVSVTYRHSQELRDFAMELGRLSGDGSADAVLPENVESKNVRPALAMEMAEERRVAEWLSERIQEIERFVGELPSIAVFVNSEDQVHSMARLLGITLEEQNIRVIACAEGQVLGGARAVRVFDVRHIKGLEFEAVFFLGVDKLAETLPDLFDKYLYVGATRAAAYLGITCEQRLPTSLARLKELFVPGWESVRPSI